MKPPKDEKFTRLWFDKPGPFQAKTSAYLRVSGTPDPEVIMLEFGVPLETGHGQATMCVPITAIDALGMLGHLQQLQMQGRLPSVAKPEKPTDVN